MGNTLKEINAERRKKRFQDLKANIIGSIEDTRLYRAIDELLYERYLKKCWKCFYKMLTEESYNKITAIEQSINKIVDSIYDRTGWWLTSYNEFEYQDNFRNMHDYEERSWNTYRIYRNENGYYVPTEEPYSSHDDYIRGVEEAFFNKNKELLAALHILLIEKEKFYNGEYQLKDESNREAANKLLIEVRAIKPKQETLKLDK